MYELIRHPDEDDALVHVRLFGSLEELIAWWDARPIDGPDEQHFLIEDRRVLMVEDPRSRKLMWCDEYRTYQSQDGGQPLYQLFRYPDADGMMELVETFKSAEDVLAWWKTRSAEPDGGQHILLENGRAIIAVESPRSRMLIFV